MMAARWRVGAHQYAVRALVFLSAIALALSAALAPLAAEPPVMAAAHPAASPAVRLVPPLPHLSAREAFLVDETTGQTMLSMNADTSMPMASTTKIMTAIVALTYGKLNQPVTVGQDAYNVRYQIASLCSGNGLVVGDVLTLKQMLYCLMIPSGDDAAVAIADTVGGSESNFVALMNLEARLIGMAHTHYANAHGLDQNGHYSSASDLVKLANYALQSPTFAQIVDTPSYVIPATNHNHEYDITNTNWLLPGLSFAYPNVIGIKTGYTGGAGGCLVFAWRHNGTTLIGAVLGEPDGGGANTDRFTDSRALLNWAIPQLTQSSASTSTATPTTQPAS
jgi:D-alanyl-D-alanine carboxypeptidase